MILWFAISFLAIAAILIVLRPLFRGERASKAEHAPELEIYKDQLNELEADVSRGVVSADDAEAARTEISRRLLEAADKSKTAGAAMGNVHVLVPAAVGAVALILSIGGYFAIGSPNLPAVPKSERVVKLQDDPNILSLIAQVEKQLEKRPKDVRGWSVLAPAYMRLRRYQDAANAFGKAIELSQPDANLQTSYGEALTMAEAGLVSAEAHKAFEKALEIDSKEPKARFYLGIAKLQDGDKEEAVRRWKTLLSDAPGNAPWSPTVMAYIARVEGTDARPPALDKETVESAQNMSEVDRQEMIRGMVDRLASKLSENGKDLNGWLRLIRARTVLGEKDKAAQALSDARAKFSGDTNALGLLNDFAPKLGLETN